MDIFGLTAPVIIAGMIMLAIVIIKVVPYILTKTAFKDYNNFDIRNSVSYHHFAGNSGANFTNLQLEVDPIKHSNGKYVVKLENLPRAFNDVNLNLSDKNCDVKVKQTVDMIFGIRVDVLWRIDASGNRYDWDDAYISLWGDHIEPLLKEASLKIKQQRLADKELVDELEGKAPFEKGKD